MPQIHKCTACAVRVTFASRMEALTAGWSFVELTTRQRVRYHVLCPAHAGLGWLRQALDLDDKPKLKADTNT